MPGPCASGCAARTTGETARRPSRRCLAPSSSRGSCVAGVGADRFQPRWRSLYRGKRCGRRRPATEGRAPKVPAIPPGQDDAGRSLKGGVRDGPAGVRLPLRSRDPPDEGAGTPREERLRVPQDSAGSGFQRRKPRRPKGSAKARIDYAQPLARPGLTLATGITNVY